MSIILWLDPGSTTTGYACIEKNGASRTILDYGIIHTTPRAPIGEKLHEIYQDISQIIETYHPIICGIEQLYMTNNQKTAIDVAQCRGILLLLCETHHIRTIPYTPLQLKQGICGNGRATKQQIQKAVQLVYRLDHIPTPDDAADALALAYITSLRSVKI